MKKAIIHLLLLMTITVSFSSCVVKQRKGAWVPGHYEYGVRGGRHWIPGHYR